MHDAQNSIDGGPPPVEAGSDPAQAGGGTSGDAEGRGGFLGYAEYLGEVPHSDSEQGLLSRVGFAAFAALRWVGPSLVLAHASMAKAQCVIHARGVRLSRIVVRPPQAEAFQVDLGSYLPG
ncbi:MAG: hypothetical protein ABI488_13910, partial [Polyangiaceae bacterium]